jgi:hypothetical protein
MKFRNLILAGVMAAMFGIAASGCNENPTTASLGNPTYVEASSTSQTSVALRWDPVSGASSYMVMWKASGTGASATDSGSASGVTANTYNVTGLTANMQYTFTVMAVSGTDMSTGQTINWAGAQHYTNDALTPATTIRIYEKLSTFGSAIQIDGGPKNVSIQVDKPGLAQLAFYVSNDTILIGPAYAITEYKAAANNNFSKIDSSVHVSDSLYSVATLDSWYTRRPLNQFIDQFSGTPGNIIAYVLRTTQTGPLGFYVRTGPAAQYHYARVLITAGANGLIMQGSGSNRFIEAQISYQNGVNLPYAKTSPSFREPRGVIAGTPGH